MSASCVFGLHFGNTSACIAHSNDGNVEVLANDAGHRVTPCVVEFTDHDHVIGASAKQGLIRNSENIVCNVKQLIGQKFGEQSIVDYQKNHAVKVVKDESTLEPMFSILYKEKETLFSIDNIIVLIYKKMIETAELQGVNGRIDIVLTVPLDFTAEQKKHIVKAAEKAGMNVLRVVSEPAAAVLAYDVGQEDIYDAGNVLVIRVGGISTTITLVQVVNGLYRVLASDTTPTGGRDYTQAIVDQLAADFKRKYGHDVKENRRATLKLEIAAEICKHTLSRQENGHVPIESLYDGIDMDAKVSRMRFNNDVSPLVQQCTDSVQKLLDNLPSDNNVAFNKEDIYKVVLCGGGTNVPILQKAVRKYFPSAQILSSLEPEEVIAVGAAKQASILASYDKEELIKHESMTEIDCLSENIYYSVINCISDSSLSGILFFKNTPLPARKHLTYSLLEPHTTFELNMSNRLIDHNDESSSKVCLNDLPLSANINATFHLRRDGTLQVTCSEKTTNKEATLTLEVKHDNAVQNSEITSEI